MLRWWVPAIIDEESIPQHDDRRQPTWYQGIAHSLMLVANPIKLTVYVGLFGGALYWGWYAPNKAGDVARMATALEQAQGNSREAADLLASGNVTNAGRLSLRTLAEWGLKTPRAYDVLYRALFDQTHPARTLDVGWFQTDPTIRFQEDGTFSVLTGDGQLTVWTSEGVALFRKHDINLSSGAGSPIFTPDSKYIIYHDIESLGRLNLRDLSVRQFSSSLTEPFVPFGSRLIAQNEERMLGCNDRIIAQYKLEGDRFPDSHVTAVWNAELPIKGRCNVLQEFDADNVLIGTTSGELVMFNLSTRAGRLLDAWRDQGDIGSIDTMFQIPDGVVINHLAEDRLLLVSHTGHLVKAFHGAGFWAKSSDDGKFVAYAPEMWDFHTPFTISPVDRPGSLDLQLKGQREFIAFTDSSHFISLDEGGVVHTRELPSGDISYTAAVLPRGFKGGILRISPASNRPSRQPTFVCQSNAPAVDKQYLRTTRVAWHVPVCQMV